MRALAILPLALALFAPPPAAAVIVRSTYDGVITSGDASGTGIPLGTQFFGVFVYDTDTPDRDGAPGQADYALLSHEIEFVGVMTLDATDNLRLIVQNDINPIWDQIVGWGQSGPGSGDWRWWIAMNDFLGPPGPLSDEGAPSPIPTSWEQMELTINLLMPSVSGPVTGFTSTIVPEPSTAALLLLGLLALCHPAVRDSVEVPQPAGGEAHPVRFETSRI